MLKQHAVSSELHLCWCLSWHKADEWLPAGPANQQLLLRLDQIAI